MSKYDIFAISMSNLVELGPLFHSLWHMFPVRLIMSGVLQPVAQGQYVVSPLPITHYPLPITLLGMLVIVGDGWQGSGPEGDVSCRTGGLLLN